MKKVHIVLVSTVIMFVAAIFMLNTSVVTTQGINYQVHEINLPLYLKILDFVDRHYNYKNLVKNIIGDTKDEGAKAIKIFDWVTSNVQNNPKELPVIDDHPLNILIRGYGVQDQFEDIFTILCTYAGMEAYFRIFRNRSGGVYYMSFVNIYGRWCPLSAYGSAYASKNGAIASVDDILRDNKLLSPFLSNVPNFETDTFLKEMNDNDFEVWNVRVKGQSPLGRVQYIVRDKFKIK